MIHGKGLPLSRGGGGSRRRGKAVRVDISRLSVCSVPVCVEGAVRVDIRLTPRVESACDSFESCL